MAKVAKPDSTKPASTKPASTSPEATPETGRARRTPQQSRSQQRVAQILAAAAQVFAEVGYEAASTTLIAAQANTSVGSLYRFFPDKAAIFQALASDYMDQVRDLFRRMLSPEVYDLPLRVIVDRVIDAYYDEFLSQPGYRAVLLDYYFSPKATAIIENINREIQPYFEALLVARAPEMDPEQRRLIAMVTVEASCVLEFVSSEADDALRARLRHEEKRLLTAYLHSYFPE